MYSNARSREFPLCDGCFRQGTRNAGSLVCYSVIAEGFRDAGDGDINVDALPSRLGVSCWSSTLRAELVVLPE